MQPKKKEIVLSRKQIEQKVKEIADKLSKK